MTLGANAATQSMSSAFSFGGLGISVTGMSVDIAYGSDAFGLSANPSTESEIDPFAAKQARLHAGPLSDDLTPQVIEGNTHLLVLNEEYSAETGSAVSAASASTSNDEAEEVAKTTAASSSTSPSSDTDSYVEPGRRALDATIMPTIERVVCVGGKCTVTGEGAVVSRDADFDFGDKPSADFMGESHTPSVESADYLANGDSSKAPYGFDFGNETGINNFVFADASTSAGGHAAPAGQHKSPAAKTQDVKAIVAATDEGATGPEDSGSGSKPVDGQPVKIAGATYKAAETSATISSASAHMVHASSDATFIDIHITHSNPALVTAGAPADAAIAATGANVPSFVVTNTPNGITHIEIAMPARGGVEGARVHFTKSTSSGIQFAGAQRGKSMGAATRARSMSLPIPTCYPGGIRSGHRDPGWAELSDNARDRIPREDLDLDLEGNISTLMFEQLRKGPDSRGTVRILRQLNTYLYNSGHADEKRSVSPAMWRGLIKRALGLLVRSVPIFDEKGLRTGIAIRNDAAAIIGMEQPTFYAWEIHFDTNLIEGQLFEEFEDVDGKTFEEIITGHLDFGLKKRIPVRAKNTLGTNSIDPSIGMAGEANLQWGIAVVSAIEGIEDKIKATTEFLLSIHKINKNAACKAIALLIKHSHIVTQRNAQDMLFDRWNEAEIRSLVKSVMMSEMWEVMGHRALRRHFEDKPEINAFLNQEIFSANYARAIDDLNRIDIQTVTEEEFWAAVEDTGVEEIIFNSVLARMAQHN